MPYRPTFIIRDYWEASEGTCCRGSAQVSYSRMTAIRGQSEVVSSILVLLTWLTSTESQEVILWSTKKAFVDAQSIARSEDRTHDLRIARELRSYTNMRPAL